MTVAWRECRAEALPFPDGSFNLVTCQSGLQFMSDKSGALAEMFRVLVEGGRAVIIVWRGLDHHPFYAALNAACIRQMGVAAMNEPFSLGDPDDLTGLAARSGFVDIESHPYSFIASFADPELFLTLQLRSAAAAIPSMRDLDAGQLEALIAAVREDMAGTIREYMNEDRVEFPMHAFAVHAQRPAMH